MRVIEVPPLDGLRWLASAWRIHFVKAPIAWVSLMAAWMMLGFSSLVLVGFLGLFLFALLQPTFFAGLMLACREQEEGKPLRVLMLFSGFQRKLGPLLSVGAISLLLHMLASILLDYLGMPRLQPTADGKEIDIAAFQAALPGKEWLFVIWAALTGLIQGALWYVPPLVVLHDMSAGHALRWSVYAFVTNFGAALLCGIAVLVMYFIALLPAGIGMFIALPLMAICNYTSYKAVFAADPPQAGDTPSQET